MHYRIYDIDPLLTPFVEVICSVESSLSIDASAPIRVLPDARMELFINFCEPQQVCSSKGITSSHSRSFITSRMNNFMDVWTHAKVGFISICFAGGGAYPFFPVSMHEVANQVIDLGDIWGRSADDMQDRVEAAKTTLQRVQLIQQYLIAQRQQAKNLDSGIATSEMKHRTCLGFCLWV